MDKRVLIIKPLAFDRRNQVPLLLDLFAPWMLGYRMLKVSRPVWEKHYHKHVDQPYFEKLMNDVSGRDGKGLWFVVCIVQAESTVRGVPAPLPDKAEVRKQFGGNVIHISDEEDAEYEINLWTNSEPAHAG